MIVSRFEKHSMVLNKNFYNQTVKLQFLCEFYMIVLFDNFVIATCCSHGWLDLWCGDIIGGIRRTGLGWSGETGSGEGCCDHRTLRRKTWTEILLIIKESTLLFRNGLRNIKFNWGLVGICCSPERSWRRAARGNIPTCGRGGGASPRSPSCRPPCPPSTRWTWCPRPAGSPRTRSDASSWISEIICGFGSGYCPF